MVKQTVTGDWNLGTAGMLVGKLRQTRKSLRKLH